MRSMDWKKEITTIIAVVGIIIAMWWQLDSKIETRIGRVETLLTENLLAMKGEIGELKGASHSHNP